MVYLKEMELEEFYAWSCELRKTIQKYLIKSEHLMTHLGWLDISVIGLFFLIIAFITIYYAKKTGKDTQEFFLSGRNLPWYVAGTAMVATTFAADTPLAVTELVALKGIAGNWLWWNQAIGGMLTVFFFAKLWRRAGIMTDVEFT